MLLQACPPLCNALILSALQFPACAFLFASLRQVPAVQRESLDQAQATSMPDTVWSVNRFLPNLSQGNENSLVLVSSISLSAIERWFICILLLDPHLMSLGHLFHNAHDHGSLPKPLMVVCNQLLQADYGRPNFHLSRRLLRHTLIHSPTSS